MSARAKIDQSRIVLEAILHLEESMSLMSWSARMPTCADPADAPSRGEVARLNGDQRLLETTVYVSAQIA